MNANELLNYAYGNALGILGMVTSDLTQELTDWEPPGTANSVGSLYWHAVAYLDHVVHEWGTGQVPLGYRDGWREKVLLEPPDVPQGQPPVLQGVRVDLAALHEYAKAVQEAGQSWLGQLSEADLDAKIETGVGELSLGQMIELYVLWHINVHCGEIAALKGCQGVKGYPF
jgi:hypothetical protein